MSIQQMAIRNFLSFGDDDQTIDLTNQGLVFVEGENRDEPMAASNGSGKSALTEALVWGLTGKTLRGLRGDDVIREGHGVDCRVYLTGEHEGKAWEIHRSRRLGGKTAKPQLIFQVGGVVQTAMDMDETQRRIEAFLGFNYDRLANTLVFGQSDKWRFSELTDARRKELFDQILGTWRFVHAHAHVKARLKEATDAIASLTQGMDVATDKLDAQREQLKRLKTVMAAQQSAECDRLEKEIVEASKLHAKAEKAASRLPDLTGKLAEAIEKSDDLRVQHTNNTSDLNELGRALGVAETRATAAEERVVSLTTEANEVRVGSTCDACGSVITKASHNKHRKKTLSVLDTVKASLAVERNEVKTVTAAIAKEARGAKVMASLNLATADRDRIKADLREAERAARDAKRHMSDVASLTKKLDKAKSRRIGAAEANECRRLIKVHKGVLEDLAAKRAELQVTAEHLEFWVQGFGNGGVKSHYLDHVVPLMNKRARRYACHLMRGTTVEFDTQTQLKSSKRRDKFDVVVNHHHGAGKYAGSSGGEKRKVDIVVARTLQSLEEGGLGLQSDMVWWDEVFESLDETSCEAVLSFLREEAKRVPSVFVISHLQWMKPHFSRVLKVIKEGGESRIEWS